MRFLFPNKTVKGKGTMELIQWRYRGESKIMDDYAYQTLDMKRAGRQVDYRFTPGDIVIIVMALGAPE